MDELKFDELVEYIFSKAEKKEGVIQSRLKMNDKEDVKYLMLLGDKDTLSGKLTGYYTKDLMNYMFVLNTSNYSDKTPVLASITYDMDDIIITINPLFIETLNKFRYIFTLQ